MVFCVAQVVSVQLTPVTTMTMTRASTCATQNILVTQSTHERANIRATPSNADERDETGAVQLSEEEIRLQRVMAALRRHAASLGISEDELLRELEKEQKNNQKEKKASKSVVKQKSQLEPVVEETDETASSQGSCSSVVDDRLEHCLHLDWNEADEQGQYQSIEQVLLK
jgi:hypothetical protein